MKNGHGLFKKLPKWRNFANLVTLLAIGNLLDPYLMPQISAWRIYATLKLSILFLRYLAATIELLVI